MNKIITTKKAFKKVISLLLSVMMIYSMAFTGVKVSAATDTTAPTLTLTKDITAWTKGSVTITATATDSSNNVSITKPDNSVESGNSKTKTITYSVSSNGTYTFAAKDSKGNTRSQSITISNIDTTGPTLTFTTTWTNGTAKITATGDDDLSGVQSITKPDNTKVTGTSTTYSVNTSGVYTFKVTDNAGNTTTQTTQVNTDPNGDWNSKNVTLNNTEEAQLMVRVGDIDNFGYGWSSVNPFSGVETSTHSYPFYPSSNDPDGTDRIMAVSGYNSKYTSIGTNTDGYTRSSTTYAKTVNSINISYGSYLSGIYVQNAIVQMFVDDFQPGNAHGVTSGNVKYKATINEQDFPELSTIINSLDQSGPRGKLITFQIPERFLDLVRSGNISLKFDDTDDCTGDGYAIDFAKLLINKSNSTANTATIKGNVIDTATHKNIDGAIVSSGGVTTTTTDGSYTLNNVPAGQAIVIASKSGYNSQTRTIKTVVSGGAYTQDFELTPSTPPATPVISTSPPSTIYAKDKVTATINYSSDSTIKQYRINIGSTTGEWKTYTGSFEITENCTIEAKGTKQYSTVDDAGIHEYSNESATATYVVNNIDKTPPTLTLTQNPENSTNGTVTITAEASDDVAVASITTPDNNTVNFTPALNNSTTYTVTANGEYIFTAKDSVGNETMQSINVSNISSMPEVKIDVRDASGILDEYYANSTDTSKRLDKDVSDKNYVLKGDSYADFSLNSNSANGFQYSIIKNNGKQTNMPTSGWNDIDLQSQNVNQDVVLDKPGYLTQRAYDVNHMLTLTDTTNWSDPTQVFKYPYPELGYKSADISTTKDAYGLMENVVPYTITDVNGNKITVNSRWQSNTVFMSNMDIFGAYKEASKFWGYISVPEDGNYILGAVSDDGCRGWITVDGKTKQFIDMFKPQGATFGTNNITLNLKKGKYYPIYLEYFNWGGSAAFQLYYTNSQSTLTNSNKTMIPKGWFFPSKTASPGEYDQTLFTGNQGVKLPDSPGQYYIAYRTGSKNSDSSINASGNGYREGIYGPFIVKPTAPLVLNREYDNENAVVGSSFEINYTITPNDIPIEDFSSTNPQSLEISNLKFNELLPSGLSIDTSKIDSNKLSIVVNGNSISGNISQTIKYELDSTRTKYTAQPITFSIWVKSDTVNNYDMLGQNSYITYKDIDDGNRSENFGDLEITIGDADIIPPTLTLTPSTIAVTNKDVIITADVSDNVAVASITTPNKDVVEFSPATKNNSTTYTVSTNGIYEFTVTDTSGNQTTKSIDVNNIDKTGPVITIAEYNTNPTNQNITVYASTNEGTLNANSYIFTANGSYTFTATDSAGNTTNREVEITNIDKIAPTLTLAQDPSNETETTGTVTITATATDRESGVASITHDSTVVEGSSTTYTVNSNGTYTFTAIDRAGNSTTDSIAVSNIYEEASIILKHGLYDKNSAYSINESSLNVVTTMPARLAMLVDVKSSNPLINFSIDTTNISGSTIEFKKYEVSNDGSNSIKEDTLQTTGALQINNGAISISNSSNFEMKKGMKYIIVYTINPVKNNGQNLDINTIIDRTNSKSLSLTIQDLPDLF